MPALSTTGLKGCSWLPLSSGALAPGDWPQQANGSAALPVGLWVQVEGTPERPRLAVFRSNNHIYAQVRWSRAAGQTDAAVHACA